MNRAPKSDRRLALEFVALVVFMLAAQFFINRVAQWVETAPRPHWKG